MLSGLRKKISQSAKSLGQSAAESMVQSAAESAQTRIKPYIGAQSNFIRVGTKEILMSILAIAFLGGGIATIVSTRTPGLRLLGALLILLGGVMMLGPVLSLIKKKSE